MWNAVAGFALAGALRAVLSYQAEGVLFAAGLKVVTTARVQIVCREAIATDGLGAGAVYVLGFRLPQQNVDDALRGRTFATLYTLIRVCLLLSFTIAPILSRLLGSLARTVGLHVSGVRLALWTVGGIISVAGLLSWLSLRDSASSRNHHPASNATT